MWQVGLKSLAALFWKLPVKSSTALQIAYENFVEPFQNLLLKVRKSAKSLVPRF
jgi:hypothetical protein